jgi:hypothetical protein
MRFLSNYLSRRRLRAADPRQKSGIHGRADGRTIHLAWRLRRTSTVGALLPADVAIGRARRREGCGGAARDAPPAPVRADLGQATRTGAAGRPWAEFGRHGPAVLFHNAQRAPARTALGPAVGDFFDERRGHPQPRRRAGTLRLRVSAARARWGWTTGGHRLGRDMRRVRTERSGPDALRSRRCRSRDCSARTTP